MLNLPQEDGYFYKAMGVPFEMDDLNTAKSLAIHTFAKTWRCEPLTRIPGGKFGTKNLLVRSAIVIPKAFVKIDFAGRTYPIFFAEYQKPHRQMDVLERVEKAQEKKAAAVKPTILNRTWTSVVKSKWADNEVEEDDEEPESMEQDHNARDARDVPIHTDEELDEDEAASASTAEQVRLPPPVAKKKRTNAFQKPDQEEETEMQTRLRLFQQQQETLQEQIRRREQERNINIVEY